MGVGAANSIVAILNKLVIGPESFEDCHFFHTQQIPWFHFFAALIGVPHDIVLWILPFV